MHPFIITVSLKLKLLIIVLFSTLTKTPAEKTDLIHTRYFIQLFAIFLRDGLVVWYVL